MQVDKSAYDENLKKKAAAEMSKIQEELGTAIENVMSNHGFDSAYNFSLKVYRSYGYGSYREKPYSMSISFEKADEPKVADQVLEIANKRFLEALNNFAWAVQNQQGGG